MTNCFLDDNPKSSTAKTTYERLQEIGLIVFWILFSFCCYRILQLLVRWYLYGKWTFKTFNFFEFVRRRKNSNRPVPDVNALDTIPPNKKWRSSNEIVSLIHSAMSGFWALYFLTAFYDKLKEDCGLISFYHPIGEYLVFMTFGYLAEDFLDLVINERSVRIIELLFHHTVVVAAFLVTLTTDLFLGIVVIGLLMEINSIFLHTRSLMNLNGVKKKSYAFRLIALLNIATFIGFRMVVSIYLAIWVFLPSTIQNVPWYLVGINGILILSLFVSNTVLLYRVLAADGIFGKKRARRRQSLQQRHSVEPVPTNNIESSGDASYSSDADNEDNNDDFDAIDDETTLENGRPHATIHTQKPQPKIDVDDGNGTQSTIVNVTT